MNAFFMNCGAPKAKNSRHDVSVSETKRGMKGKTGEYVAV